MTKLVYRLTDHARRRWVQRVGRAESELNAAVERAELARKCVERAANAFARSHHVKATGRLGQRRGDDVVVVLEDHEAGATLFCTVRPDAVVVVVSVFRTSEILAWCAPRLRRGRVYHE